MAVLFAIALATLAAVAWIVAPLSLLIMGF